MSHSPPVPLAVGIWGILSETNWEKAWKEREVCFTAVVCMTVRISSSWMLNGVPRGVEYPYFRGQSMGPPTGIGLGYKVPPAIPAAQSAGRDGAPRPRGLQLQQGRGKKATKCPDPSFIIPFPPSQLSAASRYFSPRLLEIVSFLRGIDVAVLIVPLVCPCESISRHPFLIFFSFHLDDTIPPLFQTLFFSRFISSLAYHEQLCSSPGQDNATDSTAHP